MEYDLKIVKMPYLSGPALRLFVWLLEGPLGRFIIPTLFKNAGIHWLRAQSFNEPPTMHPIHYCAKPDSVRPMTPTPAIRSWPAPEPTPGFAFTTAYDYFSAFQQGRTTPEQVVEKVLNAIRRGDEAAQPLRAMAAVRHDEVMRQAIAAGKRIQSGRSESVLDGVPIAIKDELDLLPYPTRVGTSFLGDTCCQQDATVVARLRAAGAVLIGKTNMHEIGIGVTGLNTISGTPRNPYNLNHHSGGSSSGSAAAVAAGLCPIAIGADGGGSIRIPASFCGLVGLKSTFGRMSEYGAAPLCWSVAHLGPLAATVSDIALAYATMAGPDTQDPVSLLQPASDLQGWNQANVSDLVIGIYQPWFEHAEVETVKICKALLDEYIKMGSRVREITIPDLEAARISHSITILSEMAQALNDSYEQHHRQHGLDVRTNLLLARALTSRDYIQAQRVRTRIMSHFNKALQQVDVILTPTTGIPAPQISGGALKSGESDLTRVIEIMRFVTPANLTGLPAISFPAGYTMHGLPVGMQAIGRPWQEKSLLQMALAAEQMVQRRAPQLYHRMLT